MSGYTLSKIQTGDSIEIISIQQIAINFKILSIIKIESYPKL